MTPLPGDIILCHSNHSLIAWLIRAVEHNYWSHVAWVWNSEVAIEALANGVKLTPLTEFALDDRKRTKVVRIKQEFLTEAQLAEALKISMGYVGRPYDWYAVFKLAWFWATHKRHSDPIPDDRHELTCIETIAIPLWQVAKFQFRNEVPAGNSAPSDVDRSPKVMEIE